MADVIEPLDVEGARRDLADTKAAVNEKRVIVPRSGLPFKSYPLVVEEAEMKADEVVAKGFYLGFANEVAMRAYTPSFAETRAKLDDTKKVYRWERTSAEGVTPIAGIWYDTGLSELDQAKIYAQEKTSILVENTDLNMLTSDAIVHIPTSIYAQSLINKPEGLLSGGVLICKNTLGNTVHQTIITREICVSRFGTKSGDTWTFNAWTGIKNIAGSITDLTTFEWKYSLALNDDIRKTESGVYHIPTSPIMTSLLNRPTDATNGGTLFVRTSNLNNTTHLTLINNQGMWTCFRAGATWNAWSYHPNQSYVDDKIVNSGVGSKRDDITTLGSSTLWYMADELQAMCDRHNRTFHAGAVSGDTIANIMLNQGTNIATVTFAGGVIPANGSSATMNVTFTKGEPSAFQNSSTRWMLENGIKSALISKTSDGVYKFTASNNSAALDVNGVELNLYNYQFEALQETIHIINAGKNNIDQTLTAKQIFDFNVEIVNFIEKPRRFVMLGHFSNTGASTAHVAKVNELNRLIKAKYSKYYVDVKETLYSDSTFAALGITKTQADIDAIAADTLPPSLARDSAHLSAAMDIVIAKKIEDKLLELSYLT